MTESDRAYLTELSKSLEEANLRIVQMRLGTATPGVNPLLSGLAAALTGLSQLLALR